MQLYGTQAFIKKPTKEKVQQQEAKDNRSKAREIWGTN